MVISHQSVQLLPYKFRKFFRMWGSGIHCTDQGTLSWALCAPRNWSGVSVWIEADDELQDVEGKTPVLIFHKHCHESAAHDDVLQGYICRRGQGELGWAQEHTFSKFPALILDCLWLLWEDYDLLSPFHRGWILFWKHLFPTEVSQSVGVNFINLTSQSAVQQTFVLHL